MSNMKRFTIIVNGWIQSIIFPKSSTLDVWLGSEFVSDYQGAFILLPIDTAAPLPFSGSNCLFLRKITKRKIFACK